MSRSALSIQLTERDWNLLQGLFEARIMTIAHAASLFFQDKSEYAKKRVRKLQAAGLVGARRSFVNQPAALHLTPKGFSTLRTAGKLQMYPDLTPKAFESRARVSERTIKHELCVMDTKASFCRAVSHQPTTTLVEFSTWPQLHEFECGGFAGSEIVRPDGFIRVYKKDGDETFSHDFFLEVDRSTEEVAVLLRRAHQYQEFFRSGGFAVRNGGTALDFEEFPFRVLFVLKSAERRDNVAERLFQEVPPILTQCWLTTHGEFVGNPLGDIWIRPADLRAVLSGTRFARANQGRGFQFIRDAERSAYIENNIVKHRLLT